MSTISSFWLCSGSRQRQSLLLSLIPMLLGMLVMIVSLLSSSHPSVASETYEIPLLQPTTNAMERIAFTSYRDGNGEIYTMNADGSMQTNVTNHPANDWGAVWSPDGSRIAFVSDRAGNENIYVMQSDGSQVIQLTDHASYDRDPAWSPDGQFIAFSSWRDGNSDIYTMYSDGTHKHNLTTHIAWDSDPAWSSDGQYIAFTSKRDNNDEIYVMNADGTNQRNLTRASGGDNVAAWSPDGRYIAFTSFRNNSNGWDIYVMDTDGNNVRNISNSLGTDDHPTWSPDSSQIIFQSDRNGNWDVYTMQIDGSHQMSLTTSITEDSRPDWTTGESEPLTATPQPLTATPQPPTATPQPPTATPQPPTATPGPAEPVPWTFLLYLDGDNNLAPEFDEALAALEAQPDNPDVTIVVLLDKRGDSDTQRLVVQPGGVYMDGINRWSLGEQNMGDPQTLQTFITWTFDHYPAEHYYLSIADHGQGTLGIAWDETNAEDNLTPMELGTALDIATNGGQTAIDVLHYDACLMGLLEHAYQVRTVADYLIFSENLGWSLFAYDAYSQAGDNTLQAHPLPLAQMTAGTTAATSPRQFASSLAEIYYNRLAGGEYPSTISVLELSQVDAVHQAIDGLAQTIQANLSDIQTTIQNTRSATQMFDSRVNFRTDPDDDYADLYHFAQRLEQNVTRSEIKQAAQVVMNAITAAVVVEYHESGPVRGEPGSYWDLDNAHGIAIYFPPRSGSWSYNQYISHSLFTFTRENAWDDFLKDYYGLTGLVPEEGEILRRSPLLRNPDSAENTIYLPLMQR